jgi:hypothetical protein
MGEKLKAIIATLEAMPESQQDDIVLEIEAIIKDREFESFLASPNGQTFVDELLADAEQSESEGTITEGGWGD